MLNIICIEIYYRKLIVVRVNTHKMYNAFVRIFVSLAHYIAFKHPKESVTSRIRNKKELTKAY